MKIKIEIQTQIQIQIQIQIQKQIHKYINTDTIQTQIQTKCNGNEKKLCWAARWWLVLERKEHQIRMWAQKTYLCTGLDRGDGGGKDPTISDGCSTIVGRVSPVIAFEKYVYNLILQASCHTLCLTVITLAITHIFVHLWLAAVPRDVCQKKLLLAMINVYLSNFRLYFIVLFAQPWKLITFVEPGQAIAFPYCKKICRPWYCLPPPTRYWRKPVAPGIARKPSNQVL